MDAVGQGVRVMAFESDGGAPHAYLNADKGALNAGGVLLGAANGDFAL